MFALAEKLGGLTVRELGQRMLWREALEWVEYFRLQAEDAKKAQADAARKSGGRSRGRRW
jgi:hypothetical protein